MSAFTKLMPTYSTSVICHSKSVSGNDALADSTAKADPGTSAPNDSLPPQQGKDEGTKTYSLDHTPACTNPNVFVEKAKSVSDGLEIILTKPKSGPNLDSPEDDPIIVDDDSKDEGANIEKYDDAHFNETKDTSVKTPSSPRSIQLQELKNEFFLLQSQKHRLELEKAKVEAEAIELKARPSSFNMEQLKELMLPSKFIELSGEVKNLKKLLNELEVELPTELKEIPSKLEDFTKTVTCLTSQVVELKTLQWELPEEFLSVPTYVASVQAKLKTLDSLPRRSSESGSNDDDETRHVSGSLVESSRTKKLKKFDYVTESGGHFHLTEEQINVQKKVEEDAKAKAAKLERERRREELVDLLGPEVVEKAYKEKLQYDIYYDKMLNKWEQAKITNCDVLTRKGPTILKVYREGDESEIIPNFKMEPKLSQLHKVERELGIDLDNPLGEQDPLNRPNDLARSKRKNADDLHDYFKANKKLKSSVQYEDHLTGTVLNEPVLGMIMFNSFKRQDFVTIEDFKDFYNTMLYTVQEIFFRLHQGLGLTDHARTFSSYLLAENDRRNLNPIKQMGVIEQLRQQMP
ncbi:hypothetical protein Tco_1174471 [Tanacetum coccineum]